MSVVIVFGILVTTANAFCFNPPTGPYDEDSCNHKEQKDCKAPCEWLDYDPYAVVQLYPHQSGQPYPYHTVNIGEEIDDPYSRPVGTPPCELRQVDVSKVTYKKLKAVTKCKVVLPQQPEPKSGYKKKIPIFQFKQFARTGFKFRDGIYDFVVLTSEPNEMRLLYTEPGHITRDAPGHTSLVSATEYAQLKDESNRLNLKFAGEIMLQHGHIEWWSSRSGHFWPDQSLYQVFGKHWGLPLAAGKFKTWQERGRELSGRQGAYVSYYDVYQAEEAHDDDHVMQLQARNNDWLHADRAYDQYNSAQSLSYTLLVILAMISVSFVAMMCSCMIGAFIGYTITANKKFDPVSFVSEV